MNIMAVAHKVCCVCCEEFDTKVIELEEVLPNPENKKLAAWDMCPKHRELKKEGFLHFVVVHNKPQDMEKNTLITDFDRTGVVINIHINTFKQLFKNQGKLDELVKSPVVWTDTESAFELALVYQALTEDSSILDRLHQDLGHLRPRDAVTQLLA